MLNLNLFKNKKLFIYHRVLLTIYIHSIIVVVYMKIIITLSESKFRFP